MGISIRRIRKKTGRILIRPESTKIVRFNTFFLQYVYTKQGACQFTLAPELQCIKLHKSAEIRKKKVDFLLYRIA